MKQSVTALACIMWVLSAMAVGAGQSKPNRTAQARPSFSGTWTLDIGNSKLVPRPVKVKAGTLVISQEGPALTLIETTDYEGRTETEKTTLYADGRVEKNQKSSTAVSKSRTRWDGSQLITKVSTDIVTPSAEGREGPSLSSTYDGLGGVARYSVDNSSPNFMTIMVLKNKRFTTTVKRDLSADGETLTIGTFHGSNRKPIANHIFKRAN